MSTVTVAIIAENAVILVAIVTAGHLFRQGGGWQWKTPPVPKAAPRREAEAKTPAAENPGLVPFGRDEAA